MLRKGVFFKSILISFPKPEGELFASARKKLAFSFFPIEYNVYESAPLTFLTFNVDSSFLVNLKTIISSAKAKLINNKKLIKLKLNILNIKYFYFNRLIFHH